MPAVAAAVTFMQVIAALAPYIAYAIAIGTAIESARKARSMKRQAIKDYNASLEDRLVMAATANGARSRCYGRVRNVDGVIFKGTWGDHNQMYTLVVALAGHEIDEIETIYFNDVPVTLQSDGVPLSDGRLGYWVMTPPIFQAPLISAKTSITVADGTGSVALAGTPVAGTITAVMEVGGGEAPAVATPSVVGDVATLAGANGVWTVTYQYIGFHPQARVWKYLGTPTQDMSPLLAGRFPGVISGADRFAGIAALVVDLQYNNDAWPTGVPNITAVFRGAKIYDPRSATTAWSENPALIARDWALYAHGGGCAPAEIVEPAFIAAANACDISTNFSTTAGAEIRPLYQCSIVCRLDTNPDDSFDEIVESMAGKWGWGGGALTVVAGVYRAPVASITDEWVTGAEDVVVVKDIPRTDVVNVYRPTIADAAAYINGGAGEAASTTYTVTPLPDVRSPAFIFSDGQELPREITFGGVTRSVHAQHICGVLMRDIRDGLVLRLPCSMRAWTLELFDVVAVTLPIFGFSAKLFEILSWRYTIDNGVVLTLKETAASIYDPASGLGVLNAAENSTLPLPWLVPAVTGLTVASGTVALIDGTQQTRALVSWNAVTSESVLQSGKIEVQYTEYLGGLPAADWPSILQEGSATNVTITGLHAGAPHLFRVRAINTLGVRSEWSPQVMHVIAVPAGVGSAEEAAANAAAALATLADIASDTLLTPNEKPRVILESGVITAEQADIDAKATAQAITTEKTAYDTAVTALTTYLATLTTPVLWSNLTGNTVIVGATFRSKFADVYAARQALLNLISVEIAPGAVGTVELAPAAATDVLIVDVASLSWTTPTSDPRSTLMKSIASIAYTNSGTSSVTLEITVSSKGSFTAVSWSALTHSINIMSADRTSQFGELIPNYVELFTGVETQVSPLLVFQWALAAGGSVVVDFSIDTVTLSGAGGYTAFIEEAHLRVTAIKR